MELYETIENSVHDISNEFGISRKKAKAALDLYDGQKDKAQEVLKNTINILEVKKKKNKKKKNNNKSCKCQKILRSCKKVFCACV